MDLISDFSMRGIDASSYSAENISGIEFSTYDVLVITSSWDARCLSLLDSKIDRLTSCIVLLFDDKDEDGIRDRNDVLIVQYAKSISDSQYIIKGMSTDIDYIWKQIFSALVDIKKNKLAPLSILYDLSCSPRFYSLTLLSTCFKIGVSGNVDFFYNECTYPEKVDTLSLEEVAFTAGRWNSKSIKYLNGIINPGSKNRFTVSIGFEGSKTLMTLNEYEPDNVIVITPSPGYSDLYIQRVRTANSELFRNFGVSEENEINSYAGDPVDVWQKIVKDVPPEENMNDYFLCAGSKPHSLGLTLAALSLQYPALLYSLPEKHNPVNVTPTDNCWLYKIKNLVVPV